MCGDRIYGWSWPYFCFRRIINCALFYWLTVYNLHHFSHQYCILVHWSHYIPAVSLSNRHHTLHCLCCNWKKMNVFRLRLRLFNIDCFTVCQIAIASLMFLLDFVDYLNLPGCWLNPECAWPWMENCDYHLMELTRAFVKLCYILTHSIFRCLDLIKKLTFLL